MKRTRRKGMKRWTEEDVSYYEPALSRWLLGAALVGTWVLWALTASGGCN